MPPCDWNFDERSTLVPAMLVDAGDDKPEYIPFLELALRGNLCVEYADHAPVRIGITDMYVVFIFSSLSILTHWHHDHVGGVPHILRLLDRLRKETAAVPVPRVYKYPEPVTDASMLARFATIPSAACIKCPTTDGPVWPLQDNDTVRVVDPEDASRVATLRVVYSPGHAADHCMLLLEEDHILLTGDNVLGRGSTVFENLVLYMHSIQRGLELLESRRATPMGVVGTQFSDFGENVLFPAHGPIVPRGKDTLRRYLKHRVEREEQLLALLTCDPNDNKRVVKAIADSASVLATRRPSAAKYGWTLRQLIAVLYTNYSVRMYPAVARVLLLHLQRLSCSLRELDQPPFSTQSQLPSSPYVTGRSVRIERLPSFQRSTNHIPDMPRGEVEWREMLDIPWEIL